MDELIDRFAVFGQEDPKAEAQSAYFCICVRQILIYLVLLIGFQGVGPLVA